MTNRDNPYGQGGPYGQESGYSTGGQVTGNMDIAIGSGGAGGSAPQPGAASFSLDGGASAPPADLIKDTTTADFKADVIEASRQQPVLVDFWAPWCGPCKQLTPILEKAVRAAGGKVRLVKMNIDDHPAIAGQMGVQSIPAVFAFKDGQPVDGFMGAQSESQVQAFIDKLGSSAGARDEVAEALNAAEEARQAGDLQMAAQIYSAILQREEENVEALAGLADMLFEAGQTDQAKEVLARVPDAKREAAAVAAVEAKMALAEQVAALGDRSALEARLAGDAGDHQARFDLALIQNAEGDRAAAADNLLAIIRAEREWNEDAARTQLLKFFDAWGVSDPATLAARRKLSSLLFS